MAKFISIPTTVASAQPLLFNVDNIALVSFLTTATFAIYSGAKSYTFTTSAGGASGTVAAINAAVVAISGPILVNVTLPTGVTIAALPVIA